MVHRPSGRHQYPFVILSEIVIPTVALCHLAFGYLRERFHTVRRTVPVIERIHDISIGIHKVDVIPLVIEREILYGHTRIIVEDDTFEMHIVGRYLGHYGYPAPGLDRDTLDECDLPFSVGHRPSVQVLFHRGVVLQGDPFGTCRAHHIQLEARSEHGIRIELQTDRWTYQQYRYNDYQKMVDAHGHTSHARLIKADC